MNYPNQRQVYIHRDNVIKNSVRLFLCAYQDNLTNAMKSLTHSGFKVYVAMLFSKDGFGLEFSPAYISQITGLCLDTVRKAFRELEQKNYIVPANEARTLFNFYEKPQMRQKHERREIIDPTTGQIYNYTFEELRNIVGIFEASQIWRENGGIIYE